VRETRAATRSSAARSRSSSTGRGEAGGELERRLERAEQPARGRCGRRCGRKQRPRDLRRVERRDTARIAERLLEPIRLAEAAVDEPSERGAERLGIEPAVADRRHDDVDGGALHLLRLSQNAGGDRLPPELADRNVGGESVLEDELGVAVGRLPLAVQDCLAERKPVRRLGVARQDRERPPDSERVRRRPRIPPPPDVAIAARLRQALAERSELLGARDALDRGCGSRPPEVASVSTDRSPAASSRDGATYEYVCSTVTRGTYPQRAPAEPASRRPPP
jgi:hypothetical protein